MLAGETVTEAARAAADSLLGATAAEGSPGARVLDVDRRASVVSQFENIKIKKHETVRR